MLAVDGYKWLLCPNGATFFYVSPELRRTLRPSVIGWRSDQGWRSVDQLHTTALSVCRKPPKNTKAECSIFHRALRGRRIDPDDARHRA